MHEIISILKRRPIVAILIAISWVYSAYLTYAATTAPVDFKVNEIVLNAKKEVLEIQARLDSIKNEEVDDVSELFQQLVNTYDMPAWVKYLDFTDQRFKFVVTNSAYSKTYGTPFIPRGETDQTLYKDVNLTPQQRVALLNYEKNDRLAVVQGVGKCIQVMEFAFPANDQKSMRQYPFRKCMLKHGSITYVLAFKLSQQ